ncbi:MAG: hypothetical protein R6W84_04145 [Promethearchaeia archaeon]
MKIEIDINRENWDLLSEYFPELNDLTDMELSQRTSEIINAILRSEL